MGQDKQSYLTALVVLALALSGCHRMFGIDPFDVTPRPDAGVETGDGQIDGASSDMVSSDGQLGDAAIDGPINTAFAIYFPGFDPAYVCEQTEIYGWVGLSADPEGAIVVMIASSNETHITISPSTYTFDSSNWDVVQLVTAQGHASTSIPVEIAASSTGLASHSDYLSVRATIYCN